MEIKLDNNLPLNPTLLKIFKAIPESYIVGGCIRDHILGLEPKDIDIEVYGMSQDTLASTLKQFGKVNEVGKSFGVIKLSTADDEYDFALARRETKNIGEQGHKAFSMEFDENITLEEGASRRDFTINALMYDPRREIVIDFFDGYKHLTEQKLLKHCSDHFREDPLRVLRAMQFASRFNLDMDKDTAEMCRELKSEFPTISKERVYMEWQKWATKSTKPSKGLEVLRESGWLKLFPEINALTKCPQDPLWHPEGVNKEGESREDSAFIHTAHVCDALVEHTDWKNQDLKTKEILMLGALCHDLGKPLCTEVQFKEKEGRDCIVSPGHENILKPTQAFLHSINYQGNLVSQVMQLVKYHMIHLQVPKSKAKFLPFTRNLAKNLSPSNIKDLSYIIKSDHSGRPPNPAHMPEQMEAICRIAQQDQCYEHPPIPIIKGADLAQVKSEDINPPFNCLKPGPIIGEVLKICYSAQLNCKYNETSKKEWFSKNRTKVITSTGLLKTPITGKELIKSGIKPGPELGKIKDFCISLQLDKGISDPTELITQLKESKLITKQVVNELKKQFPTVVQKRVQKDNIYEL